MKKVRVTTIVAMVFLSLTAMASNNSEKENSLITETNQREIRTSNNMSERQQSRVDVSPILKNYTSLKDALVADDSEAAQNAGKLVMNAFKKFDISGYSAEEQKVLKNIIEDATEQAEHISKSPIAEQREHFKQLSINVTDMVAITGTKDTLYQQFCPMYDGGSTWLSTSEDVKNPYYGNKMLTCGKVQKVIN